MSHARPSYDQPQANPPDLATQLRPALERLGFVVQQLDSPTQTLLMATWLYEERRFYQVLYTHYRPPGIGLHLSYVSLQVFGKMGGECLVDDTHVRKVADVRQLLLHNRRYKAARQAALDAGTLSPAHAPPAPTSSSPAA
ncbi:MAG: hypothetical protein ACRYFX_05720 [Janthinobacterium lividum]